MPRKATIVELICARCAIPFVIPAWRTKGAHNAQFCGVACKNSTRRADIRLSDDGLTAEIPLYVKDGLIRGYTLIDSIDIEWIIRNRWSVNDAGYAARGSIRLHREILGLTVRDGLEGDHINRKILDNRRCNLRVVTHDQQMQNLPSHRGARSSFRGVCWHSTSGLWVARVTQNGRRLYQAYFKSEIEAGEAARVARLRLLPGAVD